MEDLLFLSVHLNCLISKSILATLMCFGGCRSRYKNYSLLWNNIKHNFKLHVSTQVCKLVWLGKQHQIKPG